MGHREVRGDFGESRGYGVPGACQSIGYGVSETLPISCRSSSVLFWLFGKSWRNDHGFWVIIMPRSNLTVLFFFYTSPPPYKSPAERHFHRISIVNLEHCITCTRAQFRRHWGVPPPIISGPGPSHYFMTNA